MTNVENSTPTANGALLALRDGARLRISFVAPGIMRLRLAPTGVFVDEETFVVEQIDWPALPVSRSETGDDALVLETATLRAVVTPQPLALRLYDRAGQLICTTPPEGALAWTDGQRTLRLVLTPDERIYGLGQGALSSLELRGQERRMWQEWDSGRHSGNGGIPLALSTAGYGLLLNTSWPSRFIIGDAQAAVPPMRPDWAPAPWPWGERPADSDPDRLDVHIDGGELDAFIIYGPSLDQILQGYGELTGFPPLPPLWALGLIQCKNRYRDQSELLHVARGYRERGIPCDVLVIDWHWFERFGDLTWWEPFWPDPSGALDQLRKMGFRVMQAQHPFLERDCKTYPEFAEKGYVSELPGSDRDAFDHSNPEARAAWWEKIHPLFEQGIRAYWTDMGELERHPVGTKHHLGPRERVHNIYSTLWAKGLYEHQRADSDKRVVSLMRTAYAGIQRYGALMWSGDVDSAWDVLRDQVIVGQQVCMSGQPFWTTDIGGFFSHQPLWAMADVGAFWHTGEFSAELYARWFQWGAFCPLFRTHGTRPENEPWSFGPEVEAICRRYIGLRYRLLPYIYSCARQTSQTGQPFMRAMVMDFSEDLRAVKAEREFMFGPAFLVAPVTAPGERSHAVYLPAGTWYDFWTRRRYEGNQAVVVRAPLDRIPLFVRAGAVIPFGPEMLYADEKPFDPVELHIYPGREADFELYEDDGDTYAYERGAFTVTPIRYRGGRVETEHTVRIGPVQGNFEDVLQTRAWRAMLHDVNQPASVRLDGVEWESWGYDPAARTLTVNLEGRPTAAETIVAVREVGDVAQDASLEQARHEPAQGPPVCVSFDTTRPSRCRVVVRAYIEGAWGFSPTPVELRLVPPDHWSCTPGDVVRGLVESEEVWEQRWTVTWDDRVAPSVAEARLTVRARAGASLYELTLPVWLGNPALSQWLLIGPFDNPAGEGFVRAYPPEAAVDPRAVYAGKHGASIAWHRHSGPEAFGYVIADAAVPRPEMAGYAATEVWAPEARQAQIALRGEGCFRVWWNGEEVIASRAPWLVEPLLAPVSLRAGWNAVLVKLVRDAGEECAGRDWAFRLDVVDSEGVVLPGLHYRLPM
jgi:alpha-glucosidase (family GH31 glycosyl hydrolase)